MKNQINKTMDIKSKAFSIMQRSFNTYEIERKAIKSLLSDDKATSKVKQIMTLPTGFFNANDIRIQLLHEYNRKLIEKGYGVSRRELKKKDFIDMRPISTLNKNKTSEIPMLNREFMDAYNKWCDETVTSFCDIIPCFQEAVIQINTDRYMHWKLKNIDIDKKTVTIWIMDYISSDGIWTCGVAGEVTIIVKVEKKFDLSAEFIIDDNDMSKFSTIYQIIPYSELNWSDAEIKIWETYSIEYAKKTEEKLAKKDTTNIGELAKLYSRYIVLLNYILDINKPKTIRNKKHSITTNDSTHHDKTNNNDTQDQPAKLTRILGTVPIKSEKIPRRPTENTIRKYKIATWKARGGTRRLASGRLVPFKESVHHRHCLQTDETKIPQSVIRLKPTKK